MYPKLTLKPGKEKSLLNFHPWIFSGAIASINREIEEGEVVEVFSSEKKYLATAHFHDGSIAARIISFEQREINSEFWKEKITKAFSIRQHLGFADDKNTNGFRLVNAEGDGMPGLIVDVYNRTAVIQAHTISMHTNAQMFAEIISELFGNGFSVYDKSAEVLKRKNEPSVDGQNKYLLGEKGNQIISENGLKFFVDWEQGQKTGFFLDQRDNRNLLMQYAKNKKVLNAFAYSGGFSVYALQGNAALVHSVDSSRTAADWAERNIELNFPNETRHQFFTEDVFDFLKKTEEKYEVMVLDPPAFAKHQSAVKNAAIAYRNMNAEAMKRIAAQGILFTFSCSQHIDKMLFQKIIFSAAAMTKRNVHVLHQLHQPADHAFSIYHPEGEYLKGLVLFVE
ncbi:MAG TPA: class I SAM-dependent rRNA methyltransferase [Bacteroidia bacterium]|nr:class I SAM-dependent rRNA methyltransferase [Bacteroidia bacterium]